MNPPAALFGGDEPGGFEGFHVVADGWLAEAEVRFEVACAHGVFAGANVGHRAGQKLKDGTAGRIAQGA